MFNNRSFNVLVGLVIAVLAVLSIGTATNSQQTGSVAYTIPSAGENAAMSVPNVTAGRSITSDYAVLKDRQLSQRDPAPANRVPSSAYVTMKDRMLNQLDGGSTQVAGVNLSSAERYVALKARQLEQADPTTATDRIGIAVTGSTKPSSAERYANLKDAQLARLNPSETLSAGRARYMDLKEAQFEK